jgi:hypothetical protein
MSYGKDPNLITPVTTWQLTLSPDERALINCLSDIILILPKEFPPPSEIGIASFFDEWISAPYPDQMKDRPVLLKGFDILEGESLKRFGSKFTMLNEKDKRIIIDNTLISSDFASEEGIAFFKRFRYLLAGGYYTSDHGFAAIGYIGNVPLNAFPGPSEQAREMIREELKRLGLPSS